MKLTANIFGKLTRTALLAILGLTLCTSISQAAKIHFWVYVRGNWVLVVNGSNTGGRVVWDQARYCYITDRVARGETLDVVFSATQPGEYPGYAGYYSTCKLHSGIGVNTLPYDYITVVPVNVNCDDNHYWIQTNKDYKDERLPIGARQ